MPTYIEPTGDEEEAELLGRLAALRGERLTANPFTLGWSPVRLAWDQGWRHETHQIAKLKQLRRVERSIRKGQLRL